MINNELLLHKFFSIYFYQVLHFYCDICHQKYCRITYTIVHSVFVFRWTPDRREHEYFVLYYQFVIRVKQLQTKLIRLCLLFNTYVIVRALLCIKHVRCRLT